MTEGQPIRAAVAVTTGLDPVAVVRAVEQDTQMRAAGVVVARSDDLGALESLAGDVVVIACDDGTPEALSFVRAVADKDPQRPVLVLFDGVPNGFVRDVFEAGADDLIAVDGNGEPIGPRLEFAFEKAMARRQAAPPPDLTPTIAQSEQHEIITVLGPKGGTGKTTTACNIAVSLAQRGLNVIIIDLDLQFGDVGLTLGVAPERTIFDLITAGGGLDHEKVADFLTRSETGIRALLAPVRPDQADAVTPQFLRDLFPVLKESADVVIVDTCPGFTPEVIAAIDAATRLCVVGSLDAPALKNTRLALQALELMGVSRAEISLVLNRADSRNGLSVQDAATVLGRAPDVEVPLDRGVVGAMNQGRPIVLERGSEAGRALHQVAAEFIPYGKGEGPSGRWSRRGRKPGNEEADTAAEGDGRKSLASRLRKGRD